MIHSSENPRQPEAAVDPLFLNRWSPRAFSADRVNADIIASLFEAARWAPSCYNEQPWFFLYALSSQDLEVYRSILSERNRSWARKAPVLAFVLTATEFRKNRKTNHWAVFDAGAAWMSLALQARILGLYTHAMAGFDKEKAYELLRIPRDQYTVIAAVAIGYLGNAEELPEELQSREFPKNRKPLAEIAHEGKFPEKIGVNGGADEI